MFLSSVCEPLLAGGQMPAASFARFACAAVVLRVKDKIPCITSLPKVWKGKIMTARFYSFAYL